MADRNAITQPQVGGSGFRRVMKAIGVISLPILAADLTTSNTVQLFVVPAGFTVLGMNFAPSDMDAATGLTLSLGDATTPARFLSANTGGQTGTATQTIVASAIGFKYTVDTNIVLTVAAGATTPAAGTLTAVLWGYMDN
jgi:hypothetical protein